MGNLLERVPDIRSSIVFLCIFNKFLLQMLVDCKSLVSKRTACSKQQAYWEPNKGRRSNKNRYKFQIIQKLGYFMILSTHPQSLPRIFYHKLVPVWSVEDFIFLCVCVWDIKEFIRALKVCIKILSLINFEFDKFPLMEKAVL